MIPHYIGDPIYQDYFYEEQDYNNDCAVVAQMSIINQFRHELGESLISEDDAVYVSAQNGWFHDSGTNPQDVGRLMEAYGIPCHQVQNASIKQLVQELKAGHRVVCGVNSDELWAAGHPMEQFWNWVQQVFGLDNAEFSPADHAIVVTGINTSANPPTVIINDSGDPDGQSREYPLEDFKDAWANSDFFYIATDYSPEEWAQQHQSPLSSAAHSFFGDSMADEIFGGICVLGCALCGCWAPSVMLASYAAGQHIAEAMISAPEVIAASPDPVLASLAIGYDVANTVQGSQLSILLDELIQAI